MCTVLMGGGGALEERGDSEGSGEPVWSQNVEVNQHEEG